jgi:hypothetical protein
MSMAEFIDTYRATVALIQATLAERGAEPRMFEAPEVVSASFTGMPRNFILELQPDELFVRTAYHKLLDREVEPDELTAHLRLLAASAEPDVTVRESILAELAASEEALERGVRIQWL